MIYDPRPHTRSVDRSCVQKWHDRWNNRAVLTRDHVSSDFHRDCDLGNDVSSCVENKYSKCVALFFPFTMRSTIEMLIKNGCTQIKCTKRSGNCWCAWWPMFVCGRFMDASMLHNCASLICAYEHCLVFSMVVLETLKIVCGDCSWMSILFLFATIRILWLQWNAVRFR